MKLVIVITGLSTGGAEIMLLKVLERLNGRRFSPYVISLTELGEIGPRISALSIPVEAMGMRTERFPSLAAVFRLVARLKSLRPDIVHTWMYHADLIGGLAARIAGIKSVGWAVRQSNLSPKVNKRSTLAVARTCALASRWIPKRILCCSEVARQKHVEFGYMADKMVVIPNGFDLFHFKPDNAARKDVRAELGVNEDTPLVGLIGRFDPQKNHAGFFEAASLLNEKMPCVHFLLAGKGIDENNYELMRVRQHSKVTSTSHLLGFRSDISRLMASLDVLASSSVGEAFPNVLGEAMACGVPCAVTDVGDSAYIVGDTGKVVQAGDMAGLAEALEKILTMSLSERSSLGERARVRAAEYFEIGQVVQQYEAFYEDLAAVGGSKSQ